MIRCATEGYIRGRFRRCNQPATHAEEDIMDPSIEYPMCADCARMSEFVNREIGPDEKWEKHYDLGIRDAELGVNNG
jgi:hypothetical protein